jgi:hypothetical protein
MFVMEKMMVSRFHAWWQKTSKMLDAVIVTPLVALLRIMVSRLRSWWQQIKQHWVAIEVVGVVLVVVIALIIAGYWFDWTGFNGYNQVTIAHTTSGPSAGRVVRAEVYQPGKILWDWMQLLFIPALLTIGAAWFTARQNHQVEIAISNMIMT